MSEVVRLGAEDIDSGKGLFHIRRAKGRKVQYVPSSTVGLEIPGAYWNSYRPELWLFLEARTDRYLSVLSTQKAMGESVPVPIGYYKINHNANLKVRESGI